MFGGRSSSVVALALALVSCESIPPPTSIWPPDDYYVEVRYQGNAFDQRARFWRDGLAVYAEATGWKGGPAQDAVGFPVFGRMVAYRLREQSIRHLSRLLERAGLNDLSGEQTKPGGGDQPMVTIHWRSFGQTGSFWLTGPVDGVAVRVLQLVNSFLPVSCAFGCEGLAVGDPEPRHLVDLPEPTESVSGALDFYRDELLATRPPNPDLAVEAFALAVAAGDRRYAEQLIGLIEAQSSDGHGDGGVVPGGERVTLINESLIEELRRVLGR